jgi:hypothetical protein
VYLGWLVALVGGVAAARCGEPAVPRDQLTLASVIARPERLPASTYQITRGACADGTCAVVVSLVAGGKVLDSAALDWRIPDDTLARAPGDEMSGIGDPLVLQADSGWTAGSEEAAVSTYARPVRLAPGLTGLLVAQSAGFDHVKRRHYLFAAADDRLTGAWNAVEPTGPYASTVAVVPRGDGNDRIIRFIEFRSPIDGVADTLRMRAYRWNAAAARIVEDSLTDTTTAPRGLVLGPFPTVEAARKLRSAHETCLSRFLALSSAPRPRASRAGAPAGGTAAGTGTGGAAGGGAAMLALVTTSAASADSARAAVAACVPRPAAAITRWTAAR